MCLASVQKMGFTMSQEDFDAAWATNPDGGGLAYLDENGELKVFRTLDRNLLWYRYLAVNDTRTSDLLLHFRLRTHGLSDVENCHPFIVNYQEDDELTACRLAVIHNGIFSSMPHHATKSDTAMFCETILGELPNGWWYWSAGHNLVEDYVTASGSKVAILPPDGKAIIYNEAAGSWKGGGVVWYSNCYFLHRAGRGTTSHSSWVQEEEIWKALLASQTIAM